MLLDLDYQTLDFIEFKVDARQLNVVEYQKVAKLIKNLQPTDDISDESYAMSYGMEQLSNEMMSKVAQEIIPACCTNLKGIKIKENGTVREANPQDLVSHGALIQICFEIIMRLFTISTLTHEEEEAVKKQ